MKLKNPFLALLLIFTHSFAQQAGVDEFQSAPPTFSAVKTAFDLANEVVESKGWKLGTGDDEKTYVIGVGDILAPKTQPAYITSRANAYDKAMLDAWSQVRQFVGESISASAKNYYRENSAGLEDQENALIGNALNEELRKDGVNPQTATAQQKEKALTSDSFSKKVGSIASGKIVGVMSYQTFIGPGPGAGDQVAVIAIHSPKLQEMAEAMFTLNSPPPGKPYKRLIDTVSADPKQLVGKLGVRMVRDENGRRHLVSYGQARPLTASSRSISAAYSKAGLQAKAGLRFYAGAQASVLQDLENSENADEFADGTAEYESQEFFEERMEAIAPAAKFSGISTLKRWSSVDPVTKQTIAGVVLYWSPQAALVARKKGDQFNRSPTNATNLTRPDGPSRTSINERDAGTVIVGESDDDDF